MRIFRTRNVRWGVVLLSSCIFIALLYQVSRKTQAPGKVVEDVSAHLEPRAESSTQTDTSPVVPEGERIDKQKVIARKGLPSSSEESKLTYDNIAYLSYDNIDSVGEAEIAFLYDSLQDVKSLGVWKYCVFWLVRIEDPGKSVPFLIELFSEDKVEETVGFQMRRGVFGARRRLLSELGIAGGSLAEEFLLKAYRDPGSIGLAKIEYENRQINPDMAWDESAVNSFIFQQGMLGLLDINFDKYSALIESDYNRLLPIAKQFRLRVETQPNYQITKEEDDNQNKFGAIVEALGYRDLLLEFGKEELSKSSHEGLHESIINRSYNYYP